MRDIKFLATNKSVFQDNGNSEALYKNAQPGVAENTGSNVMVKINSIIRDLPLTQGWKVRQHLLKPLMSMYLNVNRRPVVVQIRTVWLGIGMNSNLEIREKDK